MARSWIVSIRWMSLRPCVILLACGGSSCYHASCTGSCRSRRSARSSYLLLIRIALRSRGSRPSSSSSWLRNGRIGRGRRARDLKSLDVLLQRRLSGAASRRRRHGPACRSVLRRGRCLTRPLIHSRWPMWSASRLLSRGPGTSWWILLGLLWCLAICRLRTILVRSLRCCIPCLYTASRLLIGRNDGCFGWRWGASLSTSC